MVHAIVMVIISLVSLPQTAPAQHLPVPAGFGFYTYEATKSPSVQSDPALTRPIGIGDCAEGGTTLSIRTFIGLSPGPVDIYFAIYAPALDAQEIFIVKPDSSVHMLSEGLEPFRSASGYESAYSNERRKVVY